MADASGARVITGGCVALAAESLPYAPFTRPWRSWLPSSAWRASSGLWAPGGGLISARLVPELRQAGDESRPASASDRAVLFQAVLRILQGVGATTPLVVVVEDLHWADASSRLLLSFLIGRLRGSVLVVATYRSDELHRRHSLRPLLAEAARDERVVRIELAPLQPERSPSSWSQSPAVDRRRRSSPRSSSAPRAIRFSPRSCSRRAAGHSCHRVLPTYWRRVSRRFRRQPPGSYGWPRSPAAGRP